MNFKNIFKKEKKSYSHRNLNFMYDGATGSIIGEPTKYSFAQELQRNISIQTILNKQLAILDACELKLFTRTSAKDSESTNKTALTLYNALQRPKCRPAPQNWNDIVEYLLTQYTYYGLTGLVLVFDGEILPQNIRHIMPVSTIEYQNNIGTDCYSATLKYGGYNTTMQFVFNDESNFYISKNTQQQMILIPFGKYNYNTCNGNTSSFVSPYQTIRESVLIQNYVLTSSKSFYENSCRPSAIISLKTIEENESVARMNDDAYLEHYDKIIKSLKTEIQGTINTGKTVVLNQPNMEIIVTPISIPTNAADVERMLQITKANIYSFVAGGSVASIEGLNEYSNNALEKLKEFYDGTLSYANQVIMNTLNSFLQDYLIEFDPSASDRKDIYLLIDRTGAEFYKRYTMESVSREYLGNEIGRADLWKIKSELSEIWAGVEPPSENLLLAEIQRKSNIAL
jgi:hypothetical protein